MSLLNNNLFQDLSITIANSSTNALSRYASKALSGALMKQIFGIEPGRVRFQYYNTKKKFLQVLVNSALQRVGGELKHVALKKAKEKADAYIYGKKKEFSYNVNTKKKIALKGKAQQQDQKEYGKMTLPDNNVVWCRDMYGNKCSDGIILAIPTKQSVSYSIISETATNGKVTTDKENSSQFQSNNLVWYDCMAMVAPNSSKNVILTKVSGRDYSRKELVSNGDIEFQVAGHILSPTPDLYPTEEVKKFIQVMQYKGIVRVKNIILDQFNIDKILIKDFSLSPVEGSMSRQDYSFSAVGIQPDSEVEVTEDTLYLDTIITNTETEKESEWSKFIKSKAEGTVYGLTEIADTVSSTGINKIHL